MKKRRRTQTVPKKKWSSNSHLTDLIRFLTEHGGDFIDRFALRFRHSTISKPPEDHQQKGEDQEDVPFHHFLQFSNEFESLITNLNQIIDLNKQTLSGKNASETTKLALQLVATANEVAMPRAPAPNSSATKNQGMDPGPEANMITKTNTATIDTQDRK